MSLTLFSRKNNGWQLCSVRVEPSTSNHFYAVKLIRGFLQAGQKVPENQSRQVWVRATIPAVDILTFLVGPLLREGFSRRRPKLYREEKLTPFEDMVLRRAKKQIGDQRPLFWRDDWSGIPWDTL